MKVLTDECTNWYELIDRLNEIGVRYECTFAPFPNRYKRLGIPDEKVPRICRGEGATVLLTKNYVDFARHELYFQALLNEGISAIVLKQPNPKTTVADVEYQVALLEPRLRNILRRLRQESEPLLCVVNESNCRIHRLQELIDKFRK
jgi:hypothetical protein